MRLSTILLIGFVLVVLCICTAEAKGTKGSKGSHGKGKSQGKGKSNDSDKSHGKGKSKKYDKGPVKIKKYEQPKKEEKQENEKNLKKGKGHDSDKSPAKAKQYEKPEKTNDKIPGKGKSHDIDKSHGKGKSHGTDKSHGKGKSHGTDKKSHGKEKSKKYDKGPVKVKKYEQPEKEEKQENEKNLKKGKGQDSDKSPAKSKQYEKPEKTNDKIPGKGKSHDIDKSHGKGKSHGTDKSHGKGKSHGTDKKSHGKEKSKKYDKGPVKVKEYEQPEKTNDKIPGKGKSHDTDKSHGKGKSHGTDKSHGKGKSHDTDKSHGKGKSHGHHKSHGKSHGHHSHKSHGKNHGHHSHKSHGKSHGHHSHKSHGKSKSHGSRGSKSNGPTGPVTPTGYCANKAPGLYPFPGDCAKYYDCISRGVTRVKICRDGKWFDRKTKRCGLPRTVDCGSGNSDPEDAAANLKEYLQQLMKTFTGATKLGCKSFSCKTSRKFPMRTCDVQYPGSLVGSALTRHTSDRRACVKDKTYKMMDNSVEVSGGCGAVFRYCYKISAEPGPQKETGCKDQCHEHAHCIRRPGGGICRCKDGFSGDGVKECVGSCTCFASGDPHYTGYDGQVVHFQGICKYLLTKYENPRDQCGGTRVEVKNEHRQNNMRVAYTRGVFVYSNNLNIYMGPRGGSAYSITVNDEEVSPNAFEDDYVFTESRRRFRLELTKCGVVIEWDGAHWVSVRIPREWGQNMTGICGNCDGDRADSYLTPTGDLSKFRDRDARLGNLFTVPDDSDLPVATCAQEDVASPCSPETKRVAESIRYCGILAAKNGVLSPILSNPAIAADAKGYMNSCVFDVCNMLIIEAEKAGDTACDAIAAFAKSVEEKHGLAVPFYNTATFCPINCGENEVYSEKVAYEPHCGDDNTAVKRVDEAPGPGCKCEAGYLRSNGKCILKEQCGCKYRRKYYKIGEEFTSANCRRRLKCDFEDGVSKIIPVQNKLPECPENAVCKSSKEGFRCQCKKSTVMNSAGQCEARCGRNKQACHKDARCVKSSCRCTDGKRGDGINTCRDVCECRASGDPHYTLYDGQKVHFQGNCTYTLTNIERNGTCGANVEVKNVNSGKRPVAYTRKVYITLPNNDRITLGRQKDTNRVMLNNLRQYGNVETAMFRLEVGRTYVAVTTSCGIVILWDLKNRVTVWVPVALADQSRLTGICGDCNGVKDDFRTKDGTPVAKKAKDRYSLIGNSYLVPSEDGDFEDGCPVADTILDCPAAAEEMLRADDKCGKMTSMTGPFRACLEHSNDASKMAESMVEDCVYDACEFRTEEARMMEAVCSAMSAMQEYCDELDVEPVAFSSANFCPEATEQCGDTMVYTDKMTSVQPSCQNPLLVGCQFNGPITRGCQCKPGLLFNGDTCVRPNQCGCITLDGRYYPIGTQQTSSDCRIRTTCVHDYGVSYLKTSELPRCGDNEECVPFSGDFQCRPIPEPEPESVSVSFIPEDETVSAVSDTESVSAVSDPGPVIVSPEEEHELNSRETAHSSSSSSSFSSNPSSSSYRPEPEDLLPPRPPDSEIKECLDPSDLRGEFYWGSQDTTTSGLKCQLWGSNKPHGHPLRKRLGGQGRFCRNMGKKIKEKPWCFTEDPNVKWEYCDNIPICGKQETFPPPPVDRGCYDETDGGMTSYDKENSVVSWGGSGRRCLPWTDGDYHQYNHSYCRNPDGQKSRPWCFIGGKRTWEYCNIDECYKAPTGVKGTAQCAVEEEVGTCTSTMTLRGNCYYSYKFDDACAFTVVLDTDKKVSKLYLPDNKIVELSPRGKNAYSGCVEVKRTPRSTIQIIAKVCGWCLQQTYSGLLENGNKCFAR